MHRVLFTIGPYPIYAFGVLVALGVVAGISLAARQAPRAGVKSEQAVETLLLSVVLGLILARLVFVLQNLPWFAAHPEHLLEIREGGLSSHGGLMGFCLAPVILARRYQVHVLDLLDLFAAPLMLGLAVGRVGCMLNGCCYGRVCTLPWALPVAGPGGIAVLRHPSPLYEGVAALGLCVLFSFLLRRRRVRGELFALMIGAYSLVRFVVEFFREGQTMGGLSLAQYVSLALMTASSAWFFYLKRSGAILAPAGPTASASAPASPPRRRDRGANR